MKTAEKLTFAPRSRGRYVCNQTGEITKNPESYRRSHQKPKSEKIIEVAKDLGSRWKCPRCHELNFHGVLYEINTCRYCSKKVKINEKVSYYIF